MCSCEMTHSCLWSTKTHSPHTSSHCQVFCAASVSMPGAYIHISWIIMTESVQWPMKPLFLHLWVLTSCSIFPLRLCLHLCQSALFRLVLGGQPFSISNDVSRKTVSRATGVPNSLQGASSSCVFYLHFMYIFEDVGCSKHEEVEIHSAYVKI